MTNLDTTGNMAQSSAGRRGRLTVVGTGICLGGQMTLEALAAIQGAEALFYVAGNPALGTWLRQVQPGAVSLHRCYGAEKPRDESYAEMASMILAAVREGRRVCAVFYGHPGVGVEPSHEVIKQARAEGYPARMLPGISAEACLYADLGVDPLTAGCQSFEATDFVQRKPAICTAAALILWQIGVVGEQTARFAREAYEPGIERLKTTLLSYYPPDHEVIAYDAAIYPVCAPRIHPMPLRELTAAQVSAMSTMFVAPLKE